MILNFLKESNKAFLLLILLLPAAYAANNLPAQKIICQDQNHCALYAQTEQGPKLVLNGSAKLINSYYSAWMDKQNNFASFDLNCGTACSYGYIVNYQTGEVSDQTYLVYAVDMQKRLIVLPDPDDQDLQTLLIRPFFCKKGQKIKRNFDPDNANAIINISFDKQGNLDLDYASTPDQKEMKEIIPINYSMINKICNKK